jgi:DNA repair exonuclease SbcCD ATPase subunit
MPPPFPLPANNPAIDDDGPIVLHRAKQQLTEVKNMQEAAKQQAEATLESVKQSEEKAKAAADKLHKQVKDAKQGIDQAQQRIHAAEQQHQESRQQLEKLQADSGSLNIAGYKPTDLAKALVEPPQPSTESEKPKIDKQTQKQIQQELKQTEEQVNDTRKQLEQAHKQVDQVEQVAKQAKQRHAGIIDRLTQLLNGLSGESGRTSHKPYMAFLILGGSLLVIAFITLLFASPYIWVILALAALVQISMGTLIKNRG